MTSYPSATKASSAVLADAATSDPANSKFELIYFGIQVRAEIPRLILAYAGAKVKYTTAVSSVVLFGPYVGLEDELTYHGFVVFFFSLSLVQEWPAMKQKTRYGSLPVSVPFSCFCQDSQQQA